MGTNSTTGTDCGSAHKYVGIYLSDHAAAALAGIELARRCTSSNRGTEVGHLLSQKIVPQIMEDRRSLETVMSRLGVSQSQIKNGAAWVGEKVGRLKLNGEITTYSPLSRVVELEALTIGIRGKQSMWEILKDRFEGDPRLNGIDLEDLIARARQQIDELTPHRLAAGAAAFATRA